MNIAVTMGDPAGIGPEISLKALEKWNNLAMTPCLIGDWGLLNGLAKKYGIKKDLVRYGENQCGIEDKIIVIDEQPLDSPRRFEFGEVSADCGVKAYSYIKRAVDLCEKGVCSGIVTGPINKESLRAAEIPHVGHTEILSALTGALNPLTLFTVGDLRVFFLSRHLSLVKACSYVKKENLIKSIKDCVLGLESLGLKNKGLAVAALNPHGSDNGMFGDEEEKELKPAIQICREKGLNVFGPVPADSVFHLAREREWGGVLSLYHDQGHIATKTLDFYGTISLTLKLPFLRSSVDHGTAFDIAGKGVANPVSMTKALEKMLDFREYDFNVFKQKGENHE